MLHRLHRRLLVMTSNRDPSELAAKWEEAWNSHDIDRILALYREDVIFKSPRIRTVSGEESGVLRGKSAVRDYLCRIFDRRPREGLLMPQCRPSAGTRKLYGVDWVTLRNIRPPQLFPPLALARSRPKFVGDGRHSPGNHGRHIARAAIDRVSPRAYSCRRKNEAPARTAPSPRHDR